ncbi:MAG: hypothetical protein HY690_20810, partial [Chloroflexi bacterium]|nr:hypothetical protein [Chloroflexota bacterium]
MEKRGRLEGSPPEAAKGQTQRWRPLRPHLLRVNAAARRDDQARFTALLHHVDVEALKRAFKRHRRAASPGVDRVTVDEDEQNLEGNLQRLHERVHRAQDWPKPALRVYSPKADGGKRGLGLPALEDKIVQSAVAEVLNALYEADFSGFSYGFRPGRSPHGALASRDKALMTQRVNWVLDFDIHTFFDALDHAWLVRMVEHRIADRRILRLIKRWLKAGILEGGEWTAVETGSPPETFNFLGCTHDCGTTRSGKFIVKRKTQATRMARKLKELRGKMRKRWHVKVPEQYAWLSQVLHGHYGYRLVKRMWFKALKRRSQKSNLNWKKFDQLQLVFPLPKPTIHQSWYT